MAAVRLLETHGLGRVFGGLKAVDGVDFTLDAGEIRAVIGPNGAGKTTFVSLVCGRIEPTSGRIVFAGEDVTALPAHERVARGIAYTFQITSIYPAHSAEENVALAVQSRLPGKGTRSTPPTSSDSAARRWSAWASAAARQQRAGTLSYGHQRLLEVAMGLALKPRLLILDEPTQGLSDARDRRLRRPRPRDRAGRDGAAHRAQHGRGHGACPPHHGDECRDDPCRGDAGGDPRRRGRPARLSGGLDAEPRRIVCHYGEARVLDGVSFEVRTGEVLCILGRNGAGKTTTLKAIMGLMRPTSGAVTLDGEVISTLPAAEVPRRGVGYVPQGRRLFAELTVRENLEIGLMTRNSGEAALRRVLDLFPVLGERLKQRAGTLSGGEQQMLAMGRALCIEPKVLLLDEPTEGLMPSMIARIRETVKLLRAEGVSSILVEQRVDAVLPVADRVIFMENGRATRSFAVAELEADPGLLHHYVGVGH